MTPLDPDAGFYIFACGKKGSGKSHLARRIFDSYPYDKLLIDPPRTAIAQMRDEGVPMEVLEADMLPARLPRPAETGEDGRPPVTYVFGPDMGSATAVDDMDRAVGLAHVHGLMCLWLNEFGAICNAHYTPPNLRRVLHHGRHQKMSLLMCCPRPMDIDGLGISQADAVAVFALPNPRDRERVAGEIGWPPQRFHQAAAALNPKRHDYLWYDDTEMVLYHMPPLPPRRAGHVPGNSPAAAVSSG